MEESDVYSVYKPIVESLKWEDGFLTLIDQTLLPNEVKYEKQISVEQVWDSIKKLKVRGAPAIGIAGAYGLLISVKEKRNSSPVEFVKTLRHNAEYLNSSRPTAVNLSWALNRMVSKAEEVSSLKSLEIYNILEKEAVKIHNEDRELCRKMGENGKTLIKEGMGILTHCNAGSLATSGIGTATAPMYTAHANGVSFRVYADETRPLLQGARLTSWELDQSGIDVTLITDNMAASMMAEGEIDLVIVGTDRVAANGDMANKIGTLGVAVLAEYYSIPFYVACPSTTVDFKTRTGKDIVIEERDPEEIRFFGEKRTGPENVKVRNPAFDVTPGKLITGYITDKGIVTPPFEKNLGKIFG